MSQHPLRAAAEAAGRGYLLNCIVTARDGETLFRGLPDGTIVACLDGYHIEPVEAAVNVEQLRKALENLCDAMEREDRWPVELEQALAVLDRSKVK